MQLVHADRVFRVEPGATPDYNRNNPLVVLLGLIEKMQLAAEREHYATEHLQYLVPFDTLDMHGPAGATDVLDPSRQDDKTDFQKQNVRAFRATDAHLVRGLVTAGDWTGPFLRLSYRGGPDSRLSEDSGHQLGDHVKVWLRVNGVPASGPILVPYHPVSDRYEIELWAYPGGDLRDRLDSRGREALARGEIVPRPDLVRGSQTDFARETLNDRWMVDVAAANGFHPIVPLHVELAWTDANERVWDSKFGANYHYEFNMLLRGWENFLAVGMSPNPHGGIGFLEYRNLFSNYGRYGARPELGRTPAPWSFDAFGTKDHGGRREPFLAVDYMDLHILKAECGIGLHRHRDNQEVFLMMEGRGLMVIGDWCKMPERERCFELRTLRAGHLAMLRGGQLHGLMNPSDEDLLLFMFGGYD